MTNTSSQRVTFYKRARYPEYWLLPDVIYWAAFMSLPEPIYFSGLRMHEERQRTRLFLDCWPNLLDFFAPYLSVDQTKKANLPIHPDIEIWDNRDSNGKYLGEREKYVELFNEAMESYLDTFYSRIHLKLKSGELKAQGLCVPKQDRIDQNFDALVALTENMDKITEDAVSVIPPEFWNMSSINWEMGTLTSKDLYYGYIRFAAADVLEQFPPIYDRSVSAEVCGDAIVRHVASSSSPPNKRRPGRPEKDWEAVALYIAEVISKSGRLPQKQDALAQDIKDWYFGKFNTHLGLSTIKSRLKKYYESGDIQKSEN